jgi:ParB family chromosome partitioning protein
MANNPKGLGKGLAALLGDDVIDSQEEKSSLFLPISQVESCASQPRKQFDPESLADLADSIREHGIIQPLTVRKLQSGYYQIIAGERRWRAARMAGLTQVPAIVIEADDRKAMELAMIENLQREDLNPIEEAEGYQVLMSQYNMTQEETAQRVGKSRSAVANALRLLNLCPPVRAMLEDGRLTNGHARALLRLQDPEVQRRAAGDMVRRGMNVAQAEAYVEKLLQSAQVTPPRGRSTYIIKDVRLFLNSVDRGLHLMRQAGVDAGWNRQDTDREILLTIRIPKRASGKIDSVSESC